MTEQSYARAARLIYLARYRAEKPKAALAQAHRLAARVVRRGAVGDAAVREAASRLVKMGSRSTLRYRVPGTGPYLAPAEPDADQRPVLDRLGAVEYELRIAVLRHLIDGTDPDDLGADSSEQIRSATAKVCRDLDVDEVRALLTGAELDPMTVAVPARRAFARRRRRVRIGGAIAGLVLAATATGLWRFDLRTEPLGWYADDPRIQTTVGRYNFDIDSWNARGELLGDAALLRRAASAWRERSGLKLPASIGPMIVFAGRVHGVAAVLMTNEITGSNPRSSDSVAVYIEGAQVRDQLHTKDHRLYVNPAHEGMQAGGIRLLDAKGFGVDEILLPPGARDVETGPLDAPAVGWKPALVDSRGVLEVPMPTIEPEQSANHRDWSPSAGIRYSEPSQNISLRPSATIQETFFDSAPLLPNIEPYDFHTGTAARPLSDADWCAVRKQAEITDHLHVSYVWQSLSDLASGPLPDGGGTGYLMIRKALGQGNVLFKDATLMSFPDKSCASATFQPGLNLLSFGYSGAVDQDPAFSSSPPSQVGDPRTAAVFWTSPAKRTYLVVAGSDKVSRLRVTGPVPAQADGRWLVVPMPATYDGTPQAEQASVEAFDSGGHRCGDPVPGTNNDRYC